MVTIDHTQLRYRLLDPAGAWTYLTIAAGQQSVQIEDFDRGLTYQFEARNVAPSGAVSAWIQQNHTVAGTTIATTGGSVLSTNMTVDSILDSGGLTATIRVYKAGSMPGTTGSANLKNGGFIAIPAYNVSGEAVGMMYWVSFDYSTGTYHVYSDKNAWLVDQSVSGFIPIGSVVTARLFTEIPVQGGGHVAIACGTGTGSIPLPTGYDAAHMLAWSTAGPGVSGSQLQGVNASTTSGATLNSSLLYRGGGSFPTSTNWVALVWSSGAAVTVSTVGAYTYVSFTTGAGDPVSFVAGTASAGSIPVPSGFATERFVGIAGMAGTSPSGKGLQVILCGVGSSLNVSANYRDGDLNTWGGSANVFGVFWQTGGGVTSQAVTNGNAVIIPIASGRKLSLVQATPNHGGSFSLPAGFEDSGVLTATSMRDQDGPAGSAVAHGILSCSCSGTTFSGLYVDGDGFQFGAYGNVLAILTA